MSISLRRRPLFYFPNGKWEKVLDKDKLKAVLNEDVDFTGSEIVEKTLFLIEQGVAQGIYCEDEVKDIQYSMLLQSPDDKTRNNRLYEFINSVYNFDNDYGIAFMTRNDERKLRFKHNVDWFQGVDKTEFELFPIIGSIHMDKPCLAKKTKDGLRIVYEDELKQIYTLKTGKDWQLLSRTEFYKAMRKMGFINYINPSYFLLAQMTDCLLPGITKKDFNKVGNYCVISSWS